uniref:Uncharacterized protein n=1 Tax=Globodera rostochiensis TaxID=31243 RepID=A0A914HP23_GLORO
MEHLVENMHAFVIDRITHEEPVLSDVVAELGVFGCLLGDKRDLSILHNKQHGYLVWTKTASLLIRSLL